jgi:O-acetyl-ADP-ribose deacetylase (regulator of RNase III)
VWQGGGAGEAVKLASCYRRSLELAHAAGLRTVAFPSISTGVYGYPVERAARVALTAVRAFLAEHALPERVTMVCFSDGDVAAYRRAAADVGRDA